MLAGIGATIILLSQFSLPSRPAYMRISPGMTALTAKGEGTADDYISLGISY